jgi:hypothetical protein
VILSPVVRIKRFSRARSVPDRAVSHGQSGGAAVQALYRQTWFLGQRMTREDVSAGGARLTKQMSAVRNRPRPPPRRPSPITAGAFDIRPMRLTASRRGVPRDVRVHVHGRGALAVPDAVTPELIASPLRAKVGCAPCQQFRRPHVPTAPRL